MSHVVYSFEAKSIQQFVFNSSKLKDMIGASEQIENLCEKDGLLDNMLNQLDLLKAVSFLRKAGGSFIAIFPENGHHSLDNAKKLQALWTLSVQRNIPGLLFVQAIGVDNNSVKQAVQNALEKQNKEHCRLFPRLPLAAPHIVRSRRTGYPAVKRQPHSIGREQEEFLDEAVSRQRDFIQNLDVNFKLISRLDLPAFETEIIFPDEMPSDTNQENDNLFPLLPNNNYVGIFHADINNLGKISQELFNNTTEDEYRQNAYRFSSLIDKSIKQAIREAVINLFENHKRTQSGDFIMPARPLIMAGDDITWILRGDVALKFARIFLGKLEKISEKYLDEHRSNYKVASLPSCLTACAGIAFIKAKQPFFQGYRLADSLCSSAKLESKKRAAPDKPVPSSIAFHRITTSLIDNYPVIRERELTTKQLELTLNPYFIGESATALGIQIQDISDLIELAKRLDKIGPGRIREMLSLLYLDEYQANRAFKRWREVMKNDGRGDLAEKIIAALLKLTGNRQQNSLKFTDLTLRDEKIRRTPLADAVSLINVEANRGEKNHVHSEI